jgi:non-canonical (house-cleaning) NTP pyrophosphatase
LAEQESRGARIPAVLIAVGSTRGPKVEAVRRLWDTPGPWSEVWPTPELLALDASAVAPRMPLSLDALCEGARRRAEHAWAEARRAGHAPALALGLEGGLELRPVAGQRRGFLMSWACATDGQRHAFGCGGAIELPARWLVDVVEGGQELSEVVDRWLGEHDVRSRQGAWGVLSRGTLDRSRVFELAVANALMPFCKHEVYA